MNTLKSFFAIISILFLPIFYCSGQIKIINNIHYTSSTLFHNADSVLVKAANSSTASGLIKPEVTKPDFIVNSFDGSYGAEQRRPNIAADSSGNYAVTWLDFRSGKKEIYAQFYDSRDNPIGSNIRVSDNPGEWNMDPAIAVNKKGDFIIAWAQSWNLLLAQRFTKDGQKKGGNLKLNDLNWYNSGIPSVAVADDGHFLVFWDVAYGTNNYGIYARIFDSSGNALAGDIPVTDQVGKGSSSGGWGNRAAAGIHNDFAVVWSQYDNNRSKIFLQRLGSNGQKTGGNVIIGGLSDSTNKYFPSIAASGDGTYLVDWEGEDTPARPYCTVEARLFNDQGNFVSDEMTLFTSRSGWHPCSVSSDWKNSFLTVWRGDTTVFCQKIQSDGKPAGKTEILKFNSEFKIWGVPAHVSNMRNDQFYTAFDAPHLMDENIYTQKFNGSLSPSGLLRQTNDDLGSASQSKPLVCFNSQGGYIVLWEDMRNGRYDLYGQVFDSRNNPVGNNLQLNEAANGSPWYLKDKSAKALSDGSFAVAFSGSPDYSFANIYIRLISPAGEKIGNTVTVYKSSDYYDEYKIVMNVDKQDNILLAWYIAGYYSSTAFLRQYSKNLSPAGPVSNFIKYTNTDKFGKSRISLSINKNLNAFAAWINYDFGKNIYSNWISGEIFDARGVALSGEMTIDSVSNGRGVSYLSNTLDDFSEKDYALAWYDGSYLHVKRNYYINSPVAYSDSFNVYSAGMPQIISFSNRKLFVTVIAGPFLLPDYNVDGFYFNDNRHEKFSFLIHQFDSSSASDLGSHFYNSAALSDNKLVFAYESCRSGLTGFDVWAKVLEIDNINSKPEWFLKPVNNDVLYPNTPNPFNSSTKISYQIYSYHKVRLAVYDILGREVKVLFDGYQEKGFYQVNFDGSGLPSGIYLCRLEAFNTFVNKMLMIK